MTINRELSQFASFVKIDDSTKNIGIATTSTPSIGIGTANPSAKFEVVGNTKLQSLNVTGITTIEVSSTSPALRITQTGTGDAILVEDSANPDSSPFVVTETGRVGIGTTNPSPSNNRYQFINNLIVRGNDSTSQRGITIDTYGNSGSQPSIAFQQWAVEAEDTKRGIIEYGPRASSTKGEFTFGDAFYIEPNSSETIGISSNIIATHSRTNIGIGTTNPTSKLHVAGNALITGVGTITTFNSTNGTITNGTITNLTGTAGTITTFNSTTGTITNLNSTTGIITNVTVSGLTSTGSLTVTGASVLFLQGIDVTGTASIDALTVFPGPSNLSGQTNLFNALNVAGITTLASSGGITTTGGDLYVGSDLYVARNANIIGVSTFGNTVVGGATTQLIVTGNARITGILTIGTSSLTLDGTNNQINVGTGVTIQHTNGVLVGSNTLRSTGLSINAISASGIATFTNGPVFIGAATSTGTASQPLQITGGAYVSGSVGIGTTNPTSNLHVIGNANITGVLTATTFSGAVSGTATSTTNIPNLTGAITSNNTTTSLGSFSSSNLSTALTDETGSGSAVFATSPTLVTPVLGDATATSIVVGSGVTINASGISAAAGIITASQLSTGASGTGVNISTDTISGPATLTIDPAAVGDNTGAVRIKGDLYVDGTQFIVNSTTIELADFNVGIATTVGTNALLDGAGIGIGSTGIRKTLTWSNSSTALKSSEDFDVASGKVYRVDGNSVLSNNTLGSGILTSSLTSVGTLGSLSVGNVNSSGIITATTFVGNLTNTLTLATSGTGLSGSTTFNNSAASTFTVASNATNANTVSTIVARDASGNFSAGTITASLTGTATSTTNIPNLTGAITSVNTATSLGSFSSSNLATALTDETGSGSAVFATSPTLVTPVLGTPQSGTLTSCTGLPLTTGVTGTLPVANGGTGVTGSTGTGSVVLSTSPTLVTPILGTPQSGTLTSCTGLPVSTGISGLAANVATFLATPSSANLASALTDETGSGSAVFATSPTLVTPVLGTPQSGTLTSCSGLPVSTGISGLGANVATFLATPSSANLISAVTDETGTGALVFATSPTLVTPVLGDATATSIVVGSVVTINASGINATTGIVTATTFQSTSDINLKENIETVNNSLNIVSQLRGVTFDWKNTHQASIGVIAQEVEQILPELVSGGEIKTVNYNGIIGILVEAIKEQQIRIEKLENKLNVQ